MNTANRYSIIIPEETLVRASGYLDALRSGDEKAGAFLSGRIQDRDLIAMKELDLLGMLFDTKQPQIFAETAVIGDGSDWNLTELGLLGDISVAVPVIIYDDGNHSHPTSHDPPFSGLLVFTPGTLLRSGYEHAPADWGEATLGVGELSTDGYYSIYRRRLLPVLRYINASAGTPRSAIVTVPGLGCGQFAGPFRGRLGSHLQEVLQRLLSEHGDSLHNIKCIYFDPYNECQSMREEVHGISFMVRPLRVSGNEKKSQLCHPHAYCETGDDFSKCSLSSIVAWDHVSWPGNDFYIGSRATDDGVKAAATNTMSVLTGITGQYDSASGKYKPPKPYSTWKDVVVEKMRGGNLRLWNSSAVWRDVQPPGVHQCEHQVR